MRRAVVVLQLDEPQLRGVVQMIGCHEHALLRHGSVLTEVGVALVEEEHRVGRAVEAGEIPLLVLGVEVLIARAFGTTIVAAAGR